MRIARTIFTGIDSAPSAPPEKPRMYDFANILFGGPCNRACPWCIGKRLPEPVNADNLRVFPPPGLDRFIEAVNRERITQVVLTGTVSDPQLYRHEARLLSLLRTRLHRAARFSVHTNGVLALRKMDVFNQYDRACISFPSFNPATYERLMGSRRVPDLEGIVRAARIPVKVSCVVNEHNVGEVDDFVAVCHRIGVRRLVFRRLYGETRSWSILEGLPVVKVFKGNPVMDFRGMEVTRWDFERSECRSINLFPDGTLGTSYLLTETPEFGPVSRGSP
jgi:MoaA/NifB/PqqE/SkfB family radical SAM enzyme